MDSLSEVLATQLEFYRRQAPTHEPLAVDYHAPVREAIIAHMRDCGALTGRVLELACGTGHFTAPLTQIAAHVDAYDAAPEMLAILNQRRLSNLTTRCVDLFTWQPDDQWDAIFFNNWLDHIPRPLLEPFFKALDAALAPGGRLVFVNVNAAETWNETAVFQRDGIDMVRRYVNGQPYDIVKYFWDPNQLMALLNQWGWTGTATTIGAEVNRGHVFYNLGRMQ